MSSDVLNSMEERQTFIAHGEAFAPLFAIHHASALLRGRQVIWMIDNMGVLCCYYKGSSEVADISCITHAALLAMAALRIQSWYEHVESAANLANGGTRGDTHAAGILLERKPLPNWPEKTLTAPPEVWREWYSSYL